MTRAELLRALARFDVELVRHGRRHDRYGIPGTSLRTSVPRHARDIPTGTLARILRDLNLTLGDLRDR